MLRIGASHFSAIVSPALNALRLSVIPTLSVSSPSNLRSLFSFLRCQIFSPKSIHSPSHPLSSYSFKHVLPMVGHPRPKGTGNYILAKTRNWLENLTMIVSYGDYACMCELILAIFSFLADYYFVFVLSNDKFGVYTISASFSTGSDVEGNREIMLQHLLVKEDDLKLLSDLQQRISGGEDLSDLAVKYSICTSKAGGGMLGWVRKGQMVYC